jgi:hypothetical protein
MVDSALINQNVNIIISELVNKHVYVLLQTPSKENIETLSALEIAEQMTYVDHQIFVSISSE